jgi:hypothetical protein
LLGPEAQVAAAGCFTLEQARQIHPTAERLYYKHINGQQCWYNKEALAKEPSAHPAQAAAPNPAARLPASGTKHTLRPPVSPPSANEGKNTDHATGDLDLIFICCAVAVPAAAGMSGL